MNMNNDVTQSRKQMILSIVGSRLMDFSIDSLLVKLDKNQKEPRGKTQWKTITLSPWVEKDAEFAGLFVHEFAHVVDIVGLPNKQGKDLSNDFYRISWSLPTVKKATEKQSSFVSGYAATNQYEDFAESFVFYVFHNRVFAERALRDESLRQKYLFFREHIFADGQFEDSDYSIGKVPSYLWDTTKLPVSLQKYLYSLY